MTAPKGFGVFILTHGRPDNQKTLRSLKRHGYTGPWWLVCDDEDSTLPDYVAKYGDRVLVFHKDDTAQDMADNGGPKSVIIYARNQTDRLAERLGLTHYAQLDDDYVLFVHRYDDGSMLKSAPINNLDEALSARVEFLDASGALTVSFAQGGDLIGGRERYPWPNRLIRKAMNGFICRTGRPIGFVGRINEDVNTYVSKGNKGDLFLTVVDLVLHQAETQTVSGGMSGVYGDLGTYHKSFYTVMHCPSAVKVGDMGTTRRRIHHRIYWPGAVPKVLAAEWRKPPPFQ